MENVKISVLMPVYNTNKKYLKQSIESILKQTFKDFEFIIIDDGSDIKTKKFLKSFKDDRIVLIENEKNLGLIKTLNKGIKLAKGEFIARMDADDISTPDRFEKQLLYMTKNPEIGVLGSAFQIFQKREEKIVMPTTDEDAKKMLQTGVSPFAHPSVMIRKDLHWRIFEHGIYAFCSGRYFCHSGTARFGHNFTKAFFQKEEGYCGSQNSCFLLCRIMRPVFHHHACVFHLPYGSTRRQHG